MQSLAARNSLITRALANSSRFHAAPPKPPERLPASQPSSSARFGRVARLSSRRPCVGCACAERSHELWSPSKAGASGALVRVQARARPARTIAPPPLPLQIWLVQQPPVPRLYRDSNVCTCGQSRSGTARCAQVVHRSEQSLRRVYFTDGWFSAGGPASAERGMPAAPGDSRRQPRW